MISFCVLLYDFIIKVIPVVILFTITIPKAGNTEKLMMN